MEEGGGIFWRARRQSETLGWVWLSKWLGQMGEFWAGERKAGIKAEEEDVVLVMLVISFISVMLNLSAVAVALVMLNVLSMTLMLIESGGVLKKSGTGERGSGGSVKPRMGKMRTVNMREVE